MIKDKQFFIVPFEIISIVCDSVIPIVEPGTRILVRLSVGSDRTGLQNQSQYQLVPEPKPEPEPQRQFSEMEKHGPVI